MTVLRCRAGIRTGLGHLVRCRVMADILRSRGIQPILVGPSSSLEIASDGDRFRDWIERPVWQNASIEAAFHADICNHFGTSKMVLDDYRSDGAHQLALRDLGITCLQQYDASQTQHFAAQMVVNSSPFERRSFYEKSFLHPDVHTFLGPKYSIIRPDFRNLKVRSSRSAVKQILITFGGGDDRGAIEKVLFALFQRIPKNINLVVMVGPSNPNAQRLKHLVELHRMDRVSIAENPEAPHEIINNSDLAILSGGTTTFEAAYCGVPMILIPIASNQYNQGRGWARLGAAKYMGAVDALDEIELTKALEALIQDRSQRQRMSEDGRRHVDGAGGHRLVDKLISIDG